MEPVPRYVSAEELRRRFNDGEYARRALAGASVRVFRRDSHPTLENSTEPFRTRSQIVTYMNGDGERIAVVHQYVRTAGTLGGSGRPDPKLLVEAGTVSRVLDKERTP